jgi:nitroreductase
MTTLSIPDLHAALSWRYAVKKYDASKKIPAATWTALEESLTLSPSSYGLQPYRFFVINDPALRAKLQQASWGQSQVVDASHFVVFAIKKNLDAAYVEHFIARTAEVRGVPAESLNGYRDAILGDLIKGPRNAWIDQWSARQAYLALGEFLTSAALLGIDATPMEGFMPPSYDDILGLGNLGYAAVVVAAAGYRHADDKYAKATKVRMPTHELIQRL